MAIPATLADIETKVRRITRSPSTAQLSQSDLDNYINTFVVYDFPEHLRTFNLRIPFTFYTNPGQDVYNTDEISFAGAINNPLYNFQNLYLTVHEPVYIAGFQAFYSQSREQFFGIYPIVNNISSIGVNGNGSSGPFTGVVNVQQSVQPPGFTQNITLLQNNVLFSAIGTPGTGEQEGMQLVDIPLVDATTGVKLNIGNLYDPNSAAYKAAVANPPTVVNPNNNINYLTGAFVLNFSMNTIVNTPINSQVVPQTNALPLALMFHNNQFTVRPVPDQSYAVNFEVYARPTALLAGSLDAQPGLTEYWQYISYGASKKIFEDRMDMDSVQMIMPEFKMQERLCLRRNLVQYTNERVSTIYSEQTGNTAYNGSWGWGGGNF